MCYSKGVHNVIQQSKCWIVCQIVRAAGTQLAQQDSTLFNYTVANLSVFRVSSN